MRILPFSHTNSVKIKIPTAQRHLDQKTRLQKFQSSISSPPCIQSLRPIYILDRLVKLYWLIYLLTENTVERPRFGASKADHIQVRPQNPPSKAWTPPPKAGILWAHLEFQSWLIFFKVVRPRFGGSKADRILLGRLYSRFDLHGSRWDCPRTSCDCFHRKSLDCCEIPYLSGGHDFVVTLWSMPYACCIVCVGCYNRIEELSHIFILCSPIAFGNAG